MIAIRPLIVTAIGIVISSTTGAALAVPCAPVLDECWIKKSTATAAPTGIFRDSFNNGITPPSGRDGANTYLMVEAGGTTGETL